MQFNDGWLSVDEVPLKWHYPVGLLYDLYSGHEPFASVEQVENTLTSVINSTSILQDPDSTNPSNQSNRTWKLTVHFSDWPDQLVKLDDAGRFLHDTFINSVKEADFLRNGTGKVVMGLSKDDSTQLWEAVQDRQFTPLSFLSLQKLTSIVLQDDLGLYNPIYQKLLNPPGTALRNVPTKFYLPIAATDASTEGSSAGSVRVVQALVPTMISSSELSDVEVYGHIAKKHVQSNRKPLATPSIQYCHLSFRAVDGAC